jgi:hypothetical protein
MLIFTDILDNLRLIAQLGIVLQSFDELAMVDQDDAQQISQAGISAFQLKLGQSELESVWNISQLLLVGFDQINDTFNIPVDIVIIGSVQIPPQDVLFV